MNLTFDSADHREVDNLLLEYREQCDTGNNCHKHCREQLGVIARDIRKSRRNPIGDMVDTHRQCLMRRQEQIRRHIVVPITDKPEQPLRAEYSAYLRQIYLQKDTPLPRAVDLRGFHIRSGNASEYAREQDKRAAESARCRKQNSDHVIVDPEFDIQIILSGQSARNRNEHRDHSKPIQYFLASEHVHGIGVRRACAEKQIDKRHKRCQNDRIEKH